MNPPTSSVSRETQFVPMSQKPPSAELPEQFTEAAALYEILSEEWIDDVSRTAVVNRKSGFQLPTMLLFFFAYFTSETTSLKKLSNTLRRRSNRLLAVFAGFDTFPTQSSVSRFLKRVWHERLEGLVTWILMTSHRSARVLLRHPICGCLDTFGGVWQLFDLDPSVTGLRHRHLGEDSSFPPAIRNTTNFAAPGYPGRKRADVIVRRTLLQHVGSSLWVGSWIRQGGGGTRETFEAAINAVVECCEFADFDPARAILRVDGEGGGVPYLTAYREAGIRYLVRCSHYGILDELDLSRLFAEGSWFEVDANKDRLALDLGDRLLRSGAATTTSEGQPYEPVLSRVVLTRTPVFDNQSGAGKIIDGYRYELFATNLEPADWPAGELVRAYFHRSAIENRLALEDRDIGLDKVFSFDLAGQALVTVIGLLVWNLRILCGFTLATDEVAAEGIPRQGSRDAQAVSVVCFEPKSDHVDEPAQDAALAVAPVDADTLEEDRVRLERALHQELDTASPKKLPPTMAWSDHGLKCENDVSLDIVATRTLDGRDYAILLAPPRTCGDCALRVDCSRSTKPTFRKQITLPIPDASRFEDLLKQLHSLEIAKQRAHTPTRARTTECAETRSSIQEVYEAPDGGPFRIALGMLNPREFAHRFAEAIADTVLHIRENPQPRTQRRRRYTHRDARVHKRHRHTWDERLAYNRRAVGPRITIFGGPCATDLTSLQTYDRAAATQARERAGLP